MEGKTALITGSAKRIGRACALKLAKEGMDILIHYNESHDDAEELAGATAAGIQTIAFNFDPEAQADVHIARFEELFELACPGRPYAAAG